MSLFFGPHNVLTYRMCRESITTYLVGLGQGSQTQFHLRATFSQKGLAGRIKRINVSAGRNRRLKVPLCYIKTVGSAII